MNTVIDNDIFGHIGDGVDNALVIIEGYPLLAVIAETDSFPHFKITAVGLYQPLEHLYKRGFAGTVPADDSDFLITGEHIVKIIKHTLVSERLGHTYRLEYFRTDI